MHYLTLDDVLEMNARFKGGHAAVRDLGLVEAAVFRPQTTVGGDDAFPDIPSKAAALFEALARYHGFIDGNKRTAVVALVVFCAMNGYRVDAEQGEMYALAMATAEGLMDAPEVANRLKPWISAIWAELEHYDVVIEVEDDEEEEPQ